MKRHCALVINDGAGYQRPLEMARMPQPRRRFAAFALIVADEARVQRDVAYSVAQLAEAVVEVDAYYQRHLPNGRRATSTRRPSPS